MIAPDSHRVMLVFGSSIAGTRPLGLSFSKAGFLRSPMSGVLSMDERRAEARGKFTHVLCFVRNFQLLEDDGNFPGVGPGG